MKKIEKENENGNGKNGQLKEEDNILEVIDSTAVESHDH